MSSVNVDRMIDSPTDQDLDAIKRTLDGKLNDLCDICGGPNGNYWLHCDAWTNWLRFGCGCNITYCESCAEVAREKSKILIAANRKKAEAKEVEILKNITPSQLARLRYRYLNDLDCVQAMRDWAVSHVGEDRARELLDVPCNYCGTMCGKRRWSFEDKDGNKHLLTIDEVESYCAKVLDRDLETQPFKVGGHDPEIVFHDSVWEYYHKKGWSCANISILNADPEEKRRYQEAREATRGEEPWEMKRFIYYMPTRQFLGIIARRDGDESQIIQIPCQTMEEEQTALSQLFKEKFGEQYHQEAEFRKLYCQIKEKYADHEPNWMYFCSNRCRSNVTDIGATTFL